MKIEFGVIEEYSVYSPTDGWSATFNQMSALIIEWC